MRIKIREVISELNARTQTHIAENIAGLEGWQRRLEMLAVEQHLALQTNLRLYAGPEPPGILESAAMLSTDGQSLMGNPGTLGNPGT